MKGRFEKIERKAVKNFAELLSKWKRYVNRFGMSSDEGQS